MQAVTLHFLLRKDNCSCLCLRANILGNLPLTLTALSQLGFLSGPIPSPSSKHKKYEKADAIPQKHEVAVQRVWAALARQ